MPDLETIKSKNTYQRFKNIINMDPNNITKEYTNGEVTVVWQSGKCIHSGNCVRNNPDVFQPKEKPWIKIDASDTQQIIETVQKCPSGALSFYLNDNAK